jgi:hypothetical protein
MAQGFERRVTMFEPFDDERFNDVNKVHPLTLGRAVLPPKAVLSHSRPCSPHCAHPLAHRTHASLPIDTARPPPVDGCGRGCGYCNTAPYAVLRLI